MSETQRAMATLKACSEAREEGRLDTVLDMVMTVIERASELVIGLYFVVIWYNNDDGKLDKDMVEDANSRLVGTGYKLVKVEEEECP